MKTHDAWVELKLWIVEEIAYEGSDSELAYHLGRVQQEMESLEDRFE